VKRRAVLIHELAHARAALAAAAGLPFPIELWSAPGAAAYAGAGWFDALVRQAAREHPAAAFIAVLHCGDRADLVQAALRQGLRHVCYTGARATAVRLADIARQYRATLHRRVPRALDLLYVEDPPAACRRWFAGD
jgi:hypothetical protein